MNILMVYQSVVDMCASFFMVLIAVVKVDGTGMSSKSSYDQFLCHFWLTRQPMWYFVSTSTYGILLTAMDRYAAVLRPIWYNSNVRTGLVTVNLVSAFETTCQYHRRLLHYSKFASYT